MSTVIKRRTNKNYFLVSWKSDNAPERLNLSYDSVSLDSGKREPVADDDIDFYSGAASSPLGQNGVEQGDTKTAATVAAGSYSEALTPVTNKVFLLLYKTSP